MCDQWRGESEGRSWGGGGQGLRCTLGSRGCLVDLADHDLAGGSKVGSLRM